MHLLGSVHVARSDLYPLPAPIEDAFAASDTLVLEVPLDAKSREGAAAAALEAGLYPRGDSLDRHLDDATKAALDQYAKEKPALGPVLLRMRPWMAATTLLVANLSELGYDADHGIDAHFHERAAKRKMRILALETMESQLALFTGLAEATQVSMLRETLESLSDIGPTMDAAFLAWKRGDAKALETELLESIRRPEYEAVFKAMFLDRNREMAERIAEYLHEPGRYFVVLGSGHLVGKGGIVDLLRAKQFQPLQR